jgi:hypothetical protein
MTKFILTFCALLLAGCNSVSQKHTDAELRFDSIGNALRNQDQRITRLESLLWESRPHEYIRVLGMVEIPGVIRLKDLDADGNYTIKRAIEYAGGFSPGAFRRRVIITRVDGQNSHIKINLDLTEAGKGSDAWSFKIQPGDIIFIPEIMM